MKTLFSLLVITGMLALAPAAQGQNAFAAFRGSYEGLVFTIETARSKFEGPVSLEIGLRKKDRRGATIKISGVITPADTVTGTGNPVPVNASVRFRRGKVSADNFLLGLRAERLPARASRWSGRGREFTFDLESANRQGRLRCKLRLTKKDELILTGGGIYRPPGGGAPQRVRIVIAPPEPEEP